MTIHKILTLAFCAIFATFSLAQEKVNAAMSKKTLADSILLDNFQKKLQNGDKRAWRDVATYRETLPQSLSLLDNYSIFPKEVFDLKKTNSKQQLLDFFYKNQEKFTYSHLYDAFCYKNLAAIKPVFKSRKLNIARAINSREILVSVETLLNNNNIDSATALLNSKRALINQQEGLVALIQLAQNQQIANFKQAQRVAFYRALGEALSFFYKEESLVAVLQLVEKQQLPAGFVSWNLARMTNVFAGHEVKDEQIVTRYRFYRDSLKSLEAMRMFGYERYHSSLQRSFFEQDVDYFGAMLATAFRTDSYWWIRENALTDMLATKHPRLLFYLATQAFKERNKTMQFGYSSQHFITYVENLTNEVIEIQNEKGEISAPNKNDLTSLKNYLVYWATHWEEYEWDEYRSIFVNKKEKLVQKEQYERLFRRLSSTNDSVAVQSYRELAEGDPAEITKLAAKYRGLLRNVNNNLPDFKYKFLEQIALLGDFCRIQNIRYQALKEEETLFAPLLDAPTPTLRYVAENRLIKSLNLTQITAFEYWGLLHQSRLSINFSISRVLDYWYSSHWNEVFENDLQLRLYLKKAYLFTQTSSSGAAAAYAKKIDIRKNAVKTRLEKLLLTENDPEIIAAIKHILAPPKQEKQESTIKENVSNEQIETLLTRLKNSATLTIDDINAVTQSPAYKAEYREICLKSLAKIAATEDVFQLKIQPRISIQQGELAYFEKMTFNIKDLDDFPRIVTVDDAPQLFRFIMASAKNASVDDLGGLVNNIFRATWFSNYLISGTFEKEQAAMLKTTLERYLNESELISEFEEQATARNMAQLDSYNKPIEERLQNAFNTANDDETKLKIMNEIISRIGYDDISKVLPFVLQMEAISGKTAITFLHEDFGIPIFEFENDKALQDFLQRHKTLTEKELYIIYLQKYGADFQKTSGDLDFDKIYNILKFDLVTPFTGANGNRRDDYVYGMVKILELHFSNRLGFHPKLNESQTFYSFNAAKRAQAWMNYLTENKLINTEKHSEIMSFNN